MRVKKRVKKGIKSVKSASPGAYLAGAGVLAGSAAVLLLITTRSGRELLIRTAELALRPKADEQASQESDVQEERQNEPAEDVDVPEEPEVETDRDQESEIRELKPRVQRPRSPRKASTPRTASKA
jgi:hypothetical protein